MAYLQLDRYARGNTQLVSGSPDEIAISAAIAKLAAPAQPEPVSYDVPGYGTITGVAGTWPEVAQ